MRFSNSEINPHSQSGEYNRSNEKNNYGENRQSFEYKAENELHMAEEIQEAEREKRPAKRAVTDSTQKISALTRYLSLITVSIAALFTAGAVYLTSGARITLKDELIGFNSYSCTLELGSTEEELTAELESGGKQIASVPVAKGQESLDLKFDGLTPEREYKLTIKDKNGGERYSQSFKTEPFVTFGAEADGKITFTLYESLTSPDALMLDMGLRLYDSEGKDFSSSIYFDPENINYIITEGLYSDTYSFGIEFYPPDAEEPTVYKKELSAGAYIKPEFEILVLDTQLVFTLISGDISPYNYFEVELFDDAYNPYYFSGSDVSFDGTSITVQMNQSIFGANDAPLVSVDGTASSGGETLSGGDYTVYIWGAFDTEEMYICNQICKITFTLVPANDGSDDSYTDLVRPIT